MSFIAGPRQVGKTTLAQIHLKQVRQEKNYYNWDTITVRKRFARNSLFFLENIPQPPPPAGPAGKPGYWVVFDEFHKHPKWKELLKGYFDEFGHFIRFVVCGSARLDMFRRSGESLLGRYFPFKMLPLGPKDLVEGKKFSFRSLWRPDRNPDFTVPSGEFIEAAENLYRLTGFPEPFLAGRKDFYRRWQNEHLSLQTTEEIRDLSRISDIVRLQNMVFLLPERVGSILSLNNLAQTLSCAHGTISTWLDAIEQVYLIFRLPPYIKKLSRLIRKEKKAYFWDWGMLDEGGKLFENFLAVQLMRTVSAWSELGWGKFNLYFVRTKDGREADFLVTMDEKPLILVEAKISETAVDPSLVYFKERLETPYAFQVVHTRDLLRQAAPGVFVIDVFRFLMLLV